MKARLENVLWFMIENGPTILTIGFSAYVIGLAQTTALSIETILQWILAILGLLAISELVERLRKLRQIEAMSRETLRAVQNKFRERASAEDYFMKHLPALEPYFEKASDICLFGTSLQRTIRENMDVLSKRISEGAKAKVILVDPNGEVLKRLATPNGDFSLEHLKTNSSLTLQNLKWLSNLPAKKGTLELKVINEEPRFTIVAIDADKDYGVIFVEFYPQRWVERGGRPRVKLTPEVDGNWFIFFKDQFNKIWDDASSVPLSSSNQWLFTIEDTGSDERGSPSGIVQMPIQTEGLD